MVRLRLTPARYTGGMTPAELAFAKLATVQLSIELGEIVQWRQGRVTRLHLMPGQKARRRVKAPAPVPVTEAGAPNA